jgi:hypothetical protein
VTFELLSFIFAVSGYGVLCYKMLGSGAVQPLSSTLLWLSLNAMNAFVTFSQGGNHLLVTGYTLGTAVTLITTLYKGSYAFAKSDLPVAGLVVICFAIWQLSSGDAAIIAASTAAFIAGLPLIRLYWHNPELCDKLTWFLFLTANLCGLFGAKSFAINQWVFPASALLYAILLLSVSFRKKSERTV